MTDELCIVFEAKASPPREPFRDAEKAFTRIRDHFRSENGIQKAYEQGNRIIQRLRRGEDVTLYNQDGLEVTQIVPGSRFPVCACITRDDFGPQVTDLTQLLEKNDEGSYPWVANILDLETISEAWSYFGWGSIQFRRFIEGRVRLHGKAVSAYELDYAGFFIKHDGFESLFNARADQVQLGIEYSDVFDEINLHVHHGGPRVTIRPSSPVLMDWRRSLSAGAPVFVDEQRADDRSGKVGRNERCPCGSGMKYKKCCGGKKLSGDVDPIGPN